MSLTLSSPAIITQAGSMNLGNNTGMGSKRGRLLIRQQRVKKDGDQGGDLETPEAGVYSDYMLSVPSSGAKMERHASEPSPVTSNFVSQQSISGQNLLSVPSHSQTSYLVKQHSHPLLPSQSTPGTSYTLTRQLSFPTQTLHSHSQTIVSTQEIVASGQLLQLQHHKPVRSHTMPQYSISDMELGENERQQIGSPTVVIIPDMSSSDHNMQHQTAIVQQLQGQQPPHQKSQHHLQLPSIRVKNEELQRSISSPLVSRGWGKLGEPRWWFYFCWLGIDKKRALVWNCHTIQSLPNASAWPSAWLQLLLEHNRRTWPNSKAQNKIPLSRMSDESLHCSMFPGISRATISGGKRSAGAGK